jgi:hypothetical protein
MGFGSLRFEKIKVWHSSSEAFHQLLRTFNTEELSDKAAGFWPDEYELAAVVEARTTSFPNLEDAWALTNSVNDRWEKPEVNMPDLYRRFSLDFHRGFSYRSTSLGDVLEAGERLFVVDALGLVEIPNPIVVARMPRNELPLHLGESKLMDRLIERRLQGETSHSS